MFTSWRRCRILWRCSEYSEDRKFSSVRAYEGLVRLYEREGCLPAHALAVAKRAEWLGQGDASRQRVEEKLQSVAAENVG